MFAALAVSHHIEAQTGWSIKKFVRTTHRYRTVRIKTGRQILTAAHPLPDELREVLATINDSHAHKNDLRQFPLTADPTPAKCGAAVPSAR